MVYPIMLYGSPVLRKVSKEIEKDFSGLKALIEDMFDTMYKADGMGLAAPQIGKSLRLFILDATSLKENEPELEGFKKVFINPSIVKEDGEEWSFNEGCLSIPLIREDVLRKQRIRIQYFDEDWKYHDEYFDGVKARIIQHEYDHLNGTLFTDKVSPLRKKLLKSKLIEISR
ncbi:MAG: peptide deformylase, partial [Bacteroidales bacterium]